MTENTVHTPKTFSLEIEKIAFDKRCTHLDAISIYCEKMGIEPVSVAKLITKSLKEKIDSQSTEFPTIDAISFLFLVCSLFLIS